MTQAPAKKPKIALMSYAMDNRGGKGTALYTRKLIERLLQDDRFEFYLVHYERVDDPLYARAREIVMPKVRLPFGSRFVRQLLFFWKYRGERFDIIHWFQPRLYPFFWFAPGHFLVATLHGAGDITAPAPFVFSKSVFNFVLRHFNRALDAIIAVSDFAKKEIAEHYGADPEKIHVTYNGGGEDFAALDKKEAQKILAARYGVRAPFILDVSRLEPHKNVERLIRAYEIAREREKFPHALLVAGFRGFGAEKTLALAEASAYASDILFLNYVEPPDLNALYAGADLLVFPSLNEGFGLPVIEAFASGTPVVTSNTTALPEISGGAALLVDPNDERAIAEGISRALRPDVRDDLVRRGLTRARAFTWDGTAKKTAALYESLLSGHHAPI